MRIEIELKNGRRAKVAPVIARHLQNRGLATVRGEMPAEGAYQTRAMAPAKAPEVELDSQGQPWSAELHTPEKIKNSNGAWRKKSGRPASEST